MATLTVRCVSCAYHWQWSGGSSLYEQQSIESRPCPSCGAYTLTCLAATDQVMPARLLLNQKRRMRNPAATK